MMEHATAEQMERLAALMNRVGVLEAIRLASSRGIGPERAQLRCGKHFLVVPYTEHLSRKRATLENTPEGRGFPPAIQVPELVLLDVLPDFFRTFCQPYRFSVQVGGRRAEMIRSESKDEQTNRKYFGLFVSHFLNARLYQMGSQAWFRTSRLMAPVEREELRRNPLTQTAASLLQSLEPYGLPPGALRLVAYLPMLSLRGMDRGRFEWGMRSLFRVLWPHHTYAFEVEFPGMLPAYGTIHPASVTKLGVQCGRLGDDFYLGDEVQHESKVLHVHLKTQTPVVMRDMEPGPLRDAVQKIGDAWLCERRLTMRLEVTFTGPLSKLVWLLGGAEDEDVGGRLGVTTFLSD